MAFFAAKVALDDAQVASLAVGSPTDPCWTDDRDRLLIEAVDALHAGADIDDELWSELAATFTEAQCLDLLLLCGWYHAISFVANGTRVPLEDSAPRFPDVRRLATANR